MAATLGQQVSRLTRQGVVSRLVNAAFRNCRQEFSSGQCLQEKWQLVSAVCVERLPVISQELSEKERVFSNLLEKIELEYSHLSDHELRHIYDKKLAERRQDEDYQETEAEVTRLMAAELEDQWEQDLKGFTPADRTTEADRTNDLQSLDRKLDDKLILLVKQRLGQDDHWVLPQSPRQYGESMRQAAERTLSELCGDSLKAQVLGNAPCGFFKYKFPKETQEQTGAIGAKVFFYKAHHRSGNVDKPDPAVTEHLWITKQELGNYVNSRYLSPLNRFILSL